MNIKQKKLLHYDNSKKFYQHLKNSPIRKMQKKENRGYILTRYKLGLNAKEIFIELKTAYGDTSPSYVTVTRWINRFKSGAEDLEDEKKSGRPITETNTSNIKRIEALIKTNPSISYSQIIQETSLSQSTIIRIIKDHLKVRKLTSRWVPHKLTNLQKSKRVAFCKQNLAMFTSKRVILLLVTSLGFIIGSLITSKIIKLGVMKVKPQEQSFDESNMSQNR